MATVNMPRLSDTMQEGTIARWLKQPGDEVKKGDVLAEIETDKATMDLEAFDAGVLEEILVRAGETAPIGQPVAMIGSGKGAQPAAAAQPVQRQEARSEDGRGAAATAAQATASRAERDGANGTRGGTTLTAPAEEGAPAGEHGAVKASPLARHMAAEHGIELDQIQGTGPGGRIVRDDIEDYLEQRPAFPAAQPVRPAAATPPAPPPPAPAPSTVPAPPPTPAAAPGEEVVKLSRMQAAIARRMAESKQTIPHFYVSTEVDVTELLALRQTLNAAAGEEGVKVSINDLIVKAAALALERHPEFNSSLRDGEFVRHAQINVGFAVDVPGGLVVPVIHDANVKGVRTIAREAKALAERARAGRLNERDLAGGTFSISNLGMLDVTDFVPIINPPEAAILAVASTRKQFVPVNDRPVVRDIMPLTMSADHRLVYGATVARFLQDVKRLLQSPYNLLG